tara:strand:+ start:4516 stop:5070 length:555 start_codon:yes stop_codon:yes gene_type:complete
MNIFILSEDPVRAAQQQCDKHVPKMIVESAQMLSTAHRMLDGIQSRRPSKSGKTLSKYWELPDAREAVLYKAVHMGHPCTVWTMESRANYVWHYIHFIALCDEYTYRYGKKHLSDLRLSTTLKNIPNSLEGDKRTPFKLAMGSNPECKFSDAVKSYRAFYQTKQERFKMVWTNREVPEWFTYAI